MNKDLLIYIVNKDTNLPSFTLGRDNFPNLGKSISSIVTQSGRTVTEASLILIWGCKNKLNDAPSYN